MHFLENTDLLKIEDILPFFPDFVVIDDFKEEICNALEGYAAHIDELKSEMDDATKNAQAIKSDIAVLKTRFVTIDAGERCSSCGNALLTRQFYVFPCQHTFHADCLIGLVRSRDCPLHLPVVMFSTGKGVPACAFAPANRCFAKRDGRRRPRADRRIKFSSSTQKPGPTTNRSTGTSLIQLYESHSEQCASGERRWTEHTLSRRQAKRAHRSGHFSDSRNGASRLDTWHRAR
jgi:hypothetical protein